MCTMGSVISFLCTLIVGFLPLRLSDFIYAFKWILSYISIKIYNKLKKDRLDFYDLNIKGQPDRVGFLPHPIEEQLESPQSELHLTRANDGIFFYGVNSKGDFLVVSIARLRNQKAEAIVHLRLASGKEYELVKKCDFQQSSPNANALTCGGLQVCCLRPMKRWRILYSGYLKETCEETPRVQRMIYVKFSLRWGASSDVYDNTSGLNDTNVAESVAKGDWKTIVPPVHELLNIFDFYAQAGNIMGIVSIEDAPENYELYLFGERMRFLGNTQMSKEIEFFHTLGFVHQNGLYLHFGQASAANVAKNVKYGFVITPSGNLRKLRKLDVFEKIDSDARDNQEIRGSIGADRSYMFCGSVSQNASWMCSEEMSISVSKINFFLDGKRGSGIHLKGKYNILPSKEIFDIVSPAIPECVYPLVVAFAEDLCQISEITGGKGSSLGKLTSLSKESLFTVPCGMVVTTSSYKRFINTELLNEIERLESVLYRRKEGDPKDVSKRVCEKITAANIPKPVIDSIVKHLVKVFGDEYESMRFAVRSSATGEDTEQMSAAGQMETFLGITGLNSILSAVKKCWASQFGFTAIQYKRRYGQCLNSPMAVVIQEMVPCDIAGVIFTCDPVSGNASKMSIAANFGLGESVVSASVEPDTIELVRDENDELRIHSITTGMKSQKTVLTADGTAFEDIPEEERQKCCLSTEDIFRLGNLAIKIEKTYRSKRDIEWGMKNGSIFLFQSRPVTSGTQETDFEIEHEFDAPLRVENEFFSISNAAEVLPGAITTLSRDIFFKIFHIVWQGRREAEIQSQVKARYFDIGWFTMNSHAMFNIADVFNKSKSGKISNFERAMMISFFGRVLDTEEIFQVAYDRYGDENKSSWKNIYVMVKNLVTSGKYLTHVQKYYADYRIPVQEYANSIDLFNAIMKHCCDVSEAFISLMVCSQASALWNMLILTVLSQDKEEMSIDVYTDFAGLITVKGGVESADVPSAIENMALEIKKSINPEDFKAMSTEEALQWLKETPSSAGRKFSEFITRHGHRCIREYDIYRTTWGSDPKPLAQLLQKLAGTISSDNTPKANTSVLKEILQLKSRTGLLSKLKLLLLAPLSRKGVQQREAAKSVLVKCLDAWRKAAWTLAKLMVSEGRIPNENILFFMTLEEVKELLINRCPRILAKAYHRQRLYPKMDEYRFPEIMRGIPKPINQNEDEMNSLDEGTSMQGIPVSQGVAKGYLRVAVTLDEAVHLKPGEILLAYGTDIGWTPYFPTLGGVATEFGGLISHGAVVSREYGLPCVAGLHGAIRRFQTGDYVLLDGNRGILQKIPPPEE